MDRYKFRGKTKKGEWFYGYYWSAAEEHYIRFMNEDKKITDVKVIADTVRTIHRTTR